ncbi:MAG: response regulator [Nitrospirota bacterium]
MEKKKILIIDDDERLLMTTKEIMENAGYEAHTHSQALGSTNVIKDLKPDLILIDINMPALSGESLAQVIKNTKSCKDIPIAFLSSNDEDSLRKLAAEHGLRGYICKGNLYELRTKVAEFLGV